VRVGVGRNAWPAELLGLRIRDVIVGSLGSPGEQHSRNRCLLAGPIALLDAQCQVLKFRHARRIYLQGLYLVTLCASRLCVNSRKVEWGRLRLSVACVRGIAERAHCCVVGSVVRACLDRWILFTFA